jgi:uncharacterized membrane protein YbhN (UPF0104 family)
VVEVNSNLKLYAKITGLAYLVAMTTSIIGYIPNQYIVANDLVQTATNIIANEQIFRIGIASNLLTCIIDVVLIWMLYLLLKPVNEKLALLAVFFRLIETGCLAMGVTNELVAVRLLTSSIYSGLMEPNQLYSFARISMASYASSFSTGFIFLGLGSTVFSYVLLKSGYVPRFLAGLGIFSSLLIALGTLLVIVFPEFRKLFPYGYGPMGVFEVTLGLWFLIKGVARPAKAGD